MGLHEQLRGAWFLHPTVDVIASISSTTAALAQSIGATSVLIYGASLGGFGALSMAALLPNARAVAEVPQIDFGSWQQSAITEVEEFILGRPLHDHRADHPERVSVIARFHAAKRVPPYLIVTNTREPVFEEQLAFHRWVSEHRPPSFSGEGHELRVIDSTAGHSALGPDQASVLIREQLRVIAS